MHPRLQEITAEIARVRTDRAGVLARTPPDQFVRDRRVVDRSRRVAAPERLVPPPTPHLTEAWDSLQKVRRRLLAAA